LSGQNTFILAIVTINQRKLAGGGVPVFIADDQTQLQTISQSLSKILDAAVHEVHEDTMIVVQH